jgi:AraC-like DNA-binding protein
VKQDWETLIPLLVHIQANLDRDLALAALSRKAGLSPFHLQRLFKAAIGETPKAYTSRLRVERAAFRLLIHDSSLLDIALECGFQNHETFIRAFHRRFGKSPRDYRKWMQGRSLQGTRTSGLPAACGSLRIGPRNDLRRVGAVGGRGARAPVAGTSGVDRDRSRCTRHDAARAAALRRGFGGARPVRARRSDRLPAPGRRPFRGHHPCRFLRHVAECLRRDLPAGHGSCRLPVRWQE